MPMAAVQTMTLPQEKLHANVHLLQSTPTRKLAPAPDRASVLVSPQDARCKKKINYTHHPYPGPVPASVARRNARERNRVKQVNNGFATLRQHIPSTVAATITGGGRGASKKLSKVDTLKLAVEYIRSLQQLLDDHDSEPGSTTTSPEPVSGYDNRSYYAGSPDSTQHPHGGHTVLINHTPPSSEASVSPSPSFTSENSPPTHHSTYQPKYYYAVDTYENDAYEPMSPEDEELLDVISWWQQQ